MARLVRPTSGSTIGLARAAATGLALLLLTGCSAGAPSASQTHPRTAAEPSASESSTTSTSPLTESTSSPPPTPQPSTAPVPTATPSPTQRASCAASIVERLSPAERAGQLLMVGLEVNAGRTSLDSLVTNRHLGGVILLGGWSSGSAAVRSTTQHLAALASPEATGGLGLFLAADQEGGAVQQLRGPGFTRIPTALDQGTMSPSALTAAATSWGRQLKQAGINVNLAPVADTVPASLGTGNQPIGRWGREYSHDPSRVAAMSVAFLKGMQAAQVATTIKHFPGIGRITGNTDLTASGITDTVTSTHDPYLTPFAAGIAAGTDFVMVGSAIYSRIDPRVNAVFSEKVVTGLLRDELGFKGVVITDDVGAAKSVAAVPAGERATRVIAAGGDIVLTARPSTVPAMQDAITARMKSDKAFSAQVEAAVTRVVTLKVKRGLATCS